MRGADAAGAAANLDTTAQSLAIFLGLDVPATGTLAESDTRALTFAR